MRTDEQHQARSAYAAAGYDISDFEDAYQGQHISFASFIEDTLIDIHGAEYENLIATCQQMGLHTPEPDMIAWQCDYWIDDATGFVFRNV